MAAIVITRNTKTLLHLLPQTPILSFCTSSPTPTPSHQIPLPLPLPLPISKTSINSLSNPLLIAEPYLNPQNSINSFQETHLLTSSIKKLFQLNRPDLIQQILQNQQQNQTNYTTEFFWLNIIKLYSNHQILDQFIPIYQNFRDLPLIRSQKFFCKILQSCFEHKRFDLVHKFFDEITLKIGVLPDVIAYEWVMKAFVEETKMDSALCLLRKIEKQEQGLEIFTYNVILNGYLKNENYEKFDEIYQEIITKKKGLKRNLVCYNLRIARLCKVKDSYIDYIATEKETDKLIGVKPDFTEFSDCSMAMKLLDEMMLDGVKPDILSYNTVIEGFCKIGDIESAKSVLERMRSREEIEVSPNKNTYLVLMKFMLKEEEFESALEMYRECIKLNWVPKYVFVQSLVKGLVKLSRENEAKEIVESAKKMLKGKALEAWQRAEGSTHPLHSL